MQKKAAAYARISTDKQNQTSLEAQFKEIAAYAESVGFAIVERYQDIMTASGAMERPGFTLMVNRAKAGMYDAIIVFKLDRWERDNIEDAIIVRELERLGVYVLSVSERYDPTTPSGRFHRGILSLTNTFYLDNLKDEVYRKTTASAERGIFQGGYPPYGYKLVKEFVPELKKEVTKYALDPVEAQIAKRILEMVAAGKSYQTVIDWLESVGAKTRKGGPWAKSAVYEMARNEKYTGTFTYRIGKKRNKRFRRDDTIRVEDAHPAIIDKATWDKIQSTRRQHTHKKSDGAGLLLRGLVFCGDCGSLMTNMGQERYRCSASMRNRKFKSVSVKAAKLEANVTTTVRDHLVRCKLDYEIIAKEFNAMVAEERIGLQTRAQELDVRIAAIKTKMQNAVRAILEGSPLAKMLEEESKGLAKELKMLEVEREREMEGEKEEIEPERLREMFEQQLRALDGDAKARWDLYRTLIKRVVVFPGGMFQVEFYD